MAHPAVAALRVKAHGDAVRTLHDQGLTWVTFDPIPGLVCDIDFGIRKLPGLGLLSGTVRGVRHVHAHRDSGDGNDDFSIHLNVSGLSTVVSRRGETTLRDGDAMLMSYSAGRTVNRPALVDHRVIRLPRASLSPLVHNIDDAVLRPIPRGTGILNLLRGYADALFDDPVLGAPDVRQLLVTQLCDLVAATIGATRDAAAVAKGRGIRVARLRAVKDDIEAHLTDHRRVLLHARHLRQGGPCRVASSRSPSPRSLELRARLPGAMSPVQSRSNSRGVQARWMPP